MNWKLTCSSLDSDYKFFDRSTIWSHNYASFEFLDQFDLTLPQSNILSEDWTLDYCRSVPFTSLRFFLFFMGEVSFEGLLSSKDIDVHAERCLERILTGPWINLELRTLDASRYKVTWKREDMEWNLWEEKNGTSGWDFKLARHMTYEFWQSWKQKVSQPTEYIHNCI